MAELILGSTFTSAQDVRQEFGTQTLNEVDPNLSLMYDRVLGTHSAGDALSDFAGTGQPEATNGTIEQECSGGSFRPVFNGNIDFYGGPTVGGVCNYRWKYDTSATFDTPSFTSTQTTSSNGSVSFTPASYDFADGTTIYSELQVWNEYNDFATSDYNETISGNSHTFTTETLNTPTLSGQTVQDDDSEFYLEFGYADGANVSSWTVEMRVDGTPSSQNPMTINCTDFNSGTNTQGIQGQMNPLTNPGESVEFRVRANGNACYNSSSFSGWQSSTDTTVPSCPITV